MKKLILDTVDSTNTYMKQFLYEEEGFIVAAKSQLAGRGRYQRKFFSPQNGLYLSILLKPEKEKMLLITPMAAVAVAETIEHFKKCKADVKWVNDIFVDGLKVSGILAEGGTYNGKAYVILGIGVNLYKPENGFDDSIKGIAGYLFEQDTGIYDAFIAYLYERLFHYYNNGGFYKEYCNRSMLTDKDITYIRNGTTYSARVKGIDENYNLLVERDGITEALFTGEVQIKVL